MNTVKTSFVTEIIVISLVGISYSIGFLISNHFVTRELAIVNAYKVVLIEKYFRFFLELDVQSYALSHMSNWMILFLNNFYLFAHLPYSVAFLLWVFTYHNNMYYSFRNSFFFGHILCIITQILYPCAPPRMLGELGFKDTMIVYSKADLMTLEEAAGVNPYAAMPSMHFAYAFLVGFWGYTLSKDKLYRFLFIYYTCLVFFCILVTGNHFVLDCLVAFVINMAAYFVIMKWEYVRKIVKSMTTSVLRKSQFWWLYILLVFGLFVISFRIVLRLISLEFY